MSERAAVLGVVDRIRQVPVQSSVVPPGGLPADTDGWHVFASPDLRPPPAASSYTTAPYIVTVGKASSARGPTAGGDINDRVYTVQVCVTGWLGYAPLDRQAGEVYAPATDASPFAEQAESAANDAYGLAEVADHLSVTLVEDYATLAACNARVPSAGTLANGFCEPFHQCSVGTVETVGADWVGADGQLPAAEVQRVIVTLSGLRRIRAQGTP